MGLTRRSPTGVRRAIDDDVLARSDHVFAGYWRPPEDSTRVLVDGWFHTGD